MITVRWLGTLMEIFGALLEGKEGKFTVVILKRFESRDW